MENLVNIHIREWMNHWLFRQEYATYFSHNYIPASSSLNFPPNMEYLMFTSVIQAAWTEIMDLVYTGSPWDARGHLRTVQSYDRCPQTTYKPVSKLWRCSDSAVIHPYDPTIKTLKHSPPPFPHPAPMACCPCLLEATAISHMLAIPCGLCGVPIA